MKNWSHLGITNLLLLINAIFLLLLVVNSSRPAGGPSDGSLAGMGPVPHAEDMSNPHVHGDEMGSAPSIPTQAPGFNFQNMALAALKCPSDPTMTLGEAACKDQEADSRRTFINSLVEQNLPPRMLFDKIIEKFGENALTQEALEIRRSNRGGR